MRLFIAVDPPPRMVSSLASVTAALSGNGRVRWINDGARHLTIQFLGEVPPDRATAVRETLRNVRSPGFTLRVSGLGFFPNERRARVLWAGVRSEGLNRLAAGIRDRLEVLGFGDTPRPFRPHITLARSRGTVPMDRGLIDKAMAWREPGFGTFEVDRFFLYESRLHPSGPEYNRVKQYPLLAGMVDEG